MNVFDFREKLVAEYGRFSRSFTRIRTKDITQAVDAAYDAGRFWPAPLIRLNPNFDSGGYVSDLVSNGTLDPECERIFRLNKRANPAGSPLRLYRHQADAIAIAKRDQSFVLTTGTGSGKSLAYFIPIVDDVLRRRRAGTSDRRITAIVVYPMNALCNSQCEELERYLKIGYGEGCEPVSFARYTGQESIEERDRIAKNPPDILLTNYVMLELIMTRFETTDVAVRKHAAGLRFLVLDELHTYRGRQGADVAMLVRRVRELLNDQLLCIGTSATMASEGPADSRGAAVARVATRLFGTEVRACGFGEMIHCGPSWQLRRAIAVFAALEGCFILNLLGQMRLPDYVGCLIAHIHWNRGPVYSRICTVPWNPVMDSSKTSPTTTLTGIKFGAWWTT